MSQPLQVPEQSHDLTDRAPQPVSGGTGLSAGDDPVLGELRRDNTLIAVALGVRAGQSAILDVLTGGGLGVLGPKPQLRERR